MARLEKIKITFSNQGIVICDSYEKTENGIAWTNGTIQGFSTNDLIRKIEDPNENK